MGTWVQKYPKVGALTSNHEYNALTMTHTFTHIHITVSTAKQRTTN